MKRRFRLRDEDTPLSLGLSFYEKDFDKVKKAIKDFELNALAEISEPNRFGVQHVWIDCTGLGSDEMKEARRFIERLKKLIAPKARENDSCVKGISSRHVHKAHDSEDLLGRRLGDSKKNIKDTDWDFIHQIKNFKYDDIETAMFELFPKEFIKDNFTDEWGDPDFSAMRLATFLDKVKKAKLLRYLSIK